MPYEYNFCLFVSGPRQFGITDAQPAKPCCCFCWTPGFLVEYKWDEAEPLWRRTFFWTQTMEELKLLNYSITTNACKKKLSRKAKGLNEIMLPIINKLWNTFPQTGEHCVFIVRRGAEECVNYHPNTHLPHFSQLTMQSLWPISLICHSKYI